MGEVVNQTFDQSRQRGAIARRPAREHVGQIRGTELDDAPAMDPGLMGVVVTGARPGEKLHEELAYEAEELQPTAIEGVLAWRSPEAEFDAETMLEDLGSARTAPDREAVLEAIGRWTPGFRQHTADCSASERVLTRAG